MKEDQLKIANSDPKPTLPSLAQLSRLPEGMQKPARILSIVLVLLNIGLFGTSLLLALGSFFLFDSPNAWNSRLVQITFWLMLTAPLPLGMAVLAAIWLQERGRYLRVALVTFLGVLYFIFLFILLIIPK